MKSYNLKKDYDKLPKRVRACVQQLIMLPNDASRFDITKAPIDIMIVRLLAADALLCTGSNVEPPATHWEDGTSKLAALQAILKGVSYGR